MNFKTLITLLLIFSTMGTASAANITYSEEYYKLGLQADELNKWHLVDNVMSPDLVSRNAWRSNGQMVSDASALASFYELRRQTILMEKQNELIAEQNEMLRNAGNLPRNCVKQNYTVNGDTIYKCGKD